MAAICIGQSCLTLETVISWIGFLFTVMITTAFSGRMVKMGAGFGKIFPSNFFQSVPRLYIAFLIEAIALSVAFEYLDPFITAWLLTNLSFLVSIVVEAFVGYYVWFCLEFNFNMHWKPLLIPQVIVALNYFLGLGSLSFLAH
jgi:hypothetical protein